MSAIEGQETHPEQQLGEEVNTNQPGGRILRSDTAATPSPSNDKLLNQIFYALANATEEQVLVFQVDAMTAHGIATELDRLAESKPYRLSYNSLLKDLKIIVMSNRIHAAHQPWLTANLGLMLNSGFLTVQEFTGLRVLSGTTFSTFGAAYTASRKEPDQCVVPSGMTLPTLLIESGWSESRTQLHCDRDLWLYGGQGSVQVVLVLKWTKTKNMLRQVKGDLEVFDLDSQGNLRSLQAETIFPTPPPKVANAQHIVLTRRQLFGPQLPAGQNPAQVVRLGLNQLRVIADEYLRLEGYVPHP